MDLRTGITLFVIISISLNLYIVLSVLSLHGKLEILKDNQLILEDYMQESEVELLKLRSGLMQEDWQYNLSVNGIYSIDTTNIFLRAGGLPPKIVTSNYYHELGHYVWNEYITAEQSIEWRSLDFKENVTEYASTQHEENFAETFKVFMLNNLTLQPQLDYFERHDIALIYRGE